MKSFEVKQFVTNKKTEKFPSQKFSMNHMPKPTFKLIYFWDSIFVKKTQENIITNCQIIVISFEIIAPLENECECNKYLPWH